MDSTTVDNNRKIAAFDQRKFFGHTIDKFGEGTLNELPEMKYHTSWDWLHPVFVKIKEYEENCSNDIFFKEEFAKLSIFNTSIFISIENAYIRVIEFLDWYNSLNK